MKNLVAFDVGNTNIKIGIYKDDKLEEISKLQTLHITTEQLFGECIRLFERHHIHEGNHDGVILSSVVPTVTDKLISICTTCFKKQPLILSSELELDHEITIVYDDPKGFGSDRIANAIGAVNVYGSPVIIVDCGTGTTFTVIDPDRRVIGGVIAPGMQISLDSLYEHVPRLPQVNIEKPDRVICDNTRESIVSGTVFGYAALIDGIISKIRKEHSAYDFKVIMTGGLSGILNEFCKEVDDTNPYLLFEGLKHYWKSINGSNREGQRKP